MTKFGVAKVFTSVLKGVVDWRIAASVKLGTAGNVRTVAEFFDAKGHSLGVSEGAGLSAFARRNSDWQQLEWKFSLHSTAVKVHLHLLSLGQAPISFARIAVQSTQGIEQNEMPYSVMVLPVEWNRDWNGGRMEMTSFADAPLLISFLFKGDKKKLKNPRFEIDIPEELEIKDAYCPFFASYGRETLVSSTLIDHNGLRMRRLRFEKMRFFQYLSSVVYRVDLCGGLVLVIGLKAVGEQMTKEFRLAYVSRTGRSSPPHGK